MSLPLSRRLVKPVATGLMASVLSALAGFAQTAAPVTAPATPARPASEEVYELPKFDVTTDGDVGYISRNSESATRLNVPISDVPQAITVFNQEFLADIGAIEIRDVADYDPSFTVTNEADNFTARGFGGTAATNAGSNYFNGFPQTASFGSQSLANVERVEVLRGPAAVLYGSGAFGGTINRISKKPLPRQQTTLRGQVDSNELYTFSIDTGGPIPLGASSFVQDENGRSKFGYRFNFQYADGFDFRDLKRGNKVIAPTVSWDITRKTKLIIDYVYQQELRVGNWENPVQGGHPEYIIVGNGTIRPVDRSIFLGAESDLREIVRHIGYMDFRHEFNKHFTFRSMFNIELKDTILNEVIPDGTRLIITPTTALVPRGYRTQDQDTDNWRSRNELVGDITTGPARHRFIVGHAWDMQRDETIRYQTAANNGPNFNPALFPPADLFDHVVGPLPALPAVPLSVHTQATNENYSLYASDLTSFFDERLFVQAGIREIRADRTSRNLRTTVPRVKDWEDTTTESAGVVYHIKRDKSLSLFANYNSTFVPNFTVNPDGSQLPSMEGNQKEVGVKFLLGGKVSGLFTVYDILQSNVPVAAPELGDGWRKVIDGVRSKGAEINFNANLTKEWMIFGGYSYNDAVGSVTGAAGQLTSRHFRAPVDGVSVFNKYTFRSGPLKRLSISLGYVWRGESLPQPLASPRVDLPWKVPPYERVDAILAYSFKLGKVAYSTSLRVRNLTDVNTNYTNAVSTLRASVEAGRETSFSVTAKF